MEPVVTLEGVKKLPGSRPFQASANAGEAAGASLPLDGRSVLYAVLDRETVLIAGVGDAFARGLPAILDDDPKATVPCSVAVLPAGSRLSDGKRPFVAVLTVPAGTANLPGRVTIRSQGHSYPFVLKHQVDDLRAFFLQVGDLTPRSETDVLDALIEALLAGGATNQVLKTAVKIIDTLAGPDGFIEVLGTFDAGDVYLQGWAKGMPAGSSRVFVYDGTLKLGGLSCCLFERKDTGGKAFGFSGLLEVEGGVEAPALRRIFYRGRSGWSAVSVHKQRTMPPAQALPSHIRTLLPKLSPAGDGKARLEQAGRRFDGRETVSELDVPVRVGVDFSASVDGAGVLLSGWLLNPEDRVEAVHFRSGGANCRLDTRWTTQRRPDVTGAFEGLSPFLSGPDAQQRHGFLVHVPPGEHTPGSNAYLEIVLRDGQSAFAPLALGRANLRLALRRLVSGLDPVTAFRPDILEHHFLPLVRAAEAPVPGIAEIIDIGSVADDAAIALVIGLDDNFEKSHVLLSLCALDPTLRGIPIVLAAAGGGMLEQVEDYRRLARFYGLDVRLVLADHVEDTLDALQVGVEAAPTEAVACLTSAVLPREAGWLEPLFDVFRAHDEACLAAPTLLYEDETIRWGGAWIEPEDGQHILRQHYLGYPRRTLHGADVAPVAAAPVDCCVLPRSALVKAGGFCRQYLGTDEKGLDAALRLKRGGTGSIWVPQVEMIHAEGGQSSKGGWKRLAADIDRRTFDQIWSPLLCDLVEDNS